MQRGRQESIASISSTSSTSSHSSISTQNTTVAIDWRHGTPPRDPHRFGPGVDFEAIMRLPQPPYRDPFNFFAPTPPMVGDREPSPMLWGLGPDSSPITGDWEAVSQRWPEVAARNDASSGAQSGPSSSPSKRTKGQGVSPTRRSTRVSVPTRPMEPYTITIPSPSRSRRVVSGSSTTSTPPKASPRRGTKRVPQPGEKASGSSGSGTRGGVKSRKSRK
ncbi:hypothetical protein E1B28_009639 [Marasmius oreades]|uniref:Uncharacterized protein n=1 Tax=Marasmius oreades TaxID=181124 RepID=A0A9P7UQY1_9AGAR|nr:uncharacterized protein E1B28_009639 [Marasmius oreades]KAG7090530.1 hypothetical protein E1B28_009639 [Marasmius oreades]